MENQEEREGEFGEAVRSLLKREYPRNAAVWVQSAVESLRACDKEIVNSSGTLRVNDVLLIRLREAGLRLRSASLEGGEHRDLLLEKACLLEKVAGHLEEFIVLMSPKKRTFGV